MIDVGRHEDGPAVLLTGGHFLAVARLVDQANAQRRHRGLAPLPLLAEIADAMRSCSFERSVVAIGHTDGSRWVPADEVSRVLHLTPRAVQQRAARGTLEARKIGRSWFVSATALEQAATAAQRPTRATRRRAATAQRTTAGHPATGTPRPPRTITIPAPN